MAETEVKEEFPHKVFVGNLAFKTTEDELKEFFADAGTVVNVNIITRGKRSLGYGFVAFSSEADCQSAVEKCHKKDLGGREINVESAKPKSELEKERKERRSSQKDVPRRRFRRSRRGPPRQKDTEDGVVVSHGDEKKSEGGRKKGPFRGERRPRPKKPVAPRQRRVPTGEPSKTTVFVANLPFSLDDDGLRAVFKDLKVKSAKVVVRRRSGRSKGFGFVDFEDEDNQKSALEAATPFTSEGRELNLKVALSDQKPAEEGEANKEEKSE